MTTTFFLVRHAAHDNLGGYLAGRMEGVRLGPDGRAQAERHIHKLFVKIRFDNFRRTTAECVSVALDASLCRKLLETAHQRAQRPVRLLGVGVRLEEEDEDHSQLGLFGTEAPVLSTDGDA